MDKKTLDSILKKPYNLILWRQVLTDVFGARNLNQTPQKILLPSNDLAENAFELGFFNTTDDRIIGFYQIDLNDKPQIWRNKVGLRDLLRNIYKYDVDGALVVFVQNDKWRLSFVSEIRVLNDDGTIDKRATEPKRYTYLLGKGEKTKTPTDRLSLLTNKKIALEDIRAAFSVEALNNEFYKQISEYFYALVGATTTKGKKTEVREKIMKLPGVAEDDRKTYQEFAVRLIGRTVFCWFLREKCSEQNKPLLPEKLLSSNAVNSNKNYYHEILEPLFFQTLNTPMKQRIEDLPTGCETVPFLNGGLFEPQIEDYYNSQSKTGSYQMYDLVIPDSWFADFFTKLEEYNFTIDENSPTEVEISVDPEMLGRIFENLLAEIDPDSGETARKATGSFYTPREIVNYMVDESLLIYLKSKLQTETVGFQAFGEDQTTLFGNEMRVQPVFEMPISNNRWQGKTDALETELRRLFSYSDNENPFNETETEILIKAIDNCKILDPACGSGAFPIGVLQRLVHLLGKLDADDSKWKEWLKRKAIKDTEQAYNEGDLSQRNERLRQISEAFEKDSSDFGRKLFLIENCIYGVDIQPIAAEISKLRCFLTLIVDDTIDENKPNRGVNPLPNLEFKFVTADALLKLPASGLFQATTETQMSELEQIRHEYINSFGAGKESAKGRFKQIQDEIFDAQIKNNRENPDKRAIALSTWNPFGHEKVDWFDSHWMFGVKAFDIVIGNPPYVSKSLSNQEKKFFKTHFITAQYQVDLYVLFIERMTELLTKNGIMSYITPNSWLKNLMMSVCRKFILDNFTLSSINPNMSNIFKSASVDTSVYVAAKTKQTAKIDVWEFVEGKPKSKNKVDQSRFYENEKYIFDVEVDEKTREKLQRIKKLSKPLSDYVEITRGVNPYDALTGQTQEVIQSRAYHSEFKKDDSFVPELRGRHIQRFSYKWDKKHYISYGDWLAAPRNTRFFQGERIVLREILGERFVCTIINEDFILDRSLYIAIPKENKDVSLKFLLAILSSKLLSWYFRFERNEFDSLFPKIRVEEFKKLPILETKTNQKPFENLVDYILFLKETDAAEQVNEYVPNSHLVEQFEEVIDALVYELYFEEDFRRASIEFLKYATRDFPPIENLPRTEKIKTIHAAYQTLRQKDGEIRNNLKLMDIRLADLIMPIKTAR